MTLDIFFLADWTEWTPYSECTKSCIESQLGSTGHGYKIKARNCEAHSDFKLGQGALDIQLPEGKLEACKCDTDRNSKFTFTQWQMNNFPTFDLS